MTVFNTTKIDLSTQPMFFGDRPNVARYDIPKYSIFNKLVKTQKSFFWNPEEINLQKDAADFKELSPHEKHIFTKNIAYQILLDSIQERAPLTAFLPWVSLPELEACIIWWSAFEQIHSQSYQWILQNIFPDPDTVFSTITDDPRIIERALEVIRYYDEFIDYSNKYVVLGPGTHKVNGKSITLSFYELKTRLYLAVASVYTLESLMFYVSFACSFAFGQRGTMKGSADIIKLIAKDESQHVGITTNIIRNWKKGDDPDFVKIGHEQEGTFQLMFDKIIDQEKAWTKYLFKDGSIVGLNEQLLNRYLEFTANKRLRSVGFKPRYDCTVDPFGWIGSWLGGEDRQDAPQEKEITDYLIGVLDMNVNEDNLIEI
jgi:ribonucleotide reductase beta subunit family protein with ferritin-like domain